MCAGERKPTRRVLEIGEILTGRHASLRWHWAHGGVEFAVRAGGDCLRARGNRNQGERDDERRREEAAHWPAPLRWHASQLRATPCHTRAAFAADFASAAFEPAL